MALYWPQPIIIREVDPTYEGIGKLLGLVLGTYGVSKIVGAEIPKGFTEKEVQMIKKKLGNKIDFEKTEEGVYKIKKIDENDPACREIKEIEDLRERWHQKGIVGLLRRISLARSPQIGIAKELTEKRLNTMLEQAKEKQTLGEVTLNLLKALGLDEKQIEKLKELSPERIRELLPILTGVTAINILKTPTIPQSRPSIPSINFFGAKTGNILDLILNDYLRRNSWRIQ